MNLIARPPVGAIKGQTLPGVPGTGQSFAQSGVHSGKLRSLSSQMVVAKEGHLECHLQPLRMKESVVI